MCVLVGRGVRCAWPEVPTPRPTSELAYTPQHPFTLLRAHECKSQERRGGGPNLLARTLGLLLDLEGPMQGRPEAEWEHFWGDKFKATL